MLVDFWANHYADLKAQGKDEYEVEDEDFDLAEVLARNEAEAEAEAAAALANPDEWEDVINVPEH